MPKWLLPTISWTLAAFFGLGLFVDIGPLRDLSPQSQSVVQLGVFLALVFLPFFETIRIGKIVELERRISHADDRAQKAEKDVSVLRSEFHSTVQVLNSSIQASSRSNATVNLNLPTQAQMTAARENLKATGTAEPGAVEEAAEEYGIDDEDRVLALARVRVNIESELLRLKELAVVGGATHLYDRPHRSAGILLKQLVPYYPQLKTLYIAIRNVLEVCNAALHAQPVTAELADDALRMGVQIITELKALSEVSASRRGN